MNKTVLILSVIFIILSGMYLLVSLGVVGKVYSTVHGIEAGCFDSCRGLRISLGCSEKHGVTRCEYRCIGIYKNSCSR